MRETSSCTSRKGGWFIKSLSLKMSLVFRETRLSKQNSNSQSAAEKLFLTTRTRMMMTCTSLPPLLLKLLHGFLNRFCSSFFSSSSLLSSSVCLLLLLLRVGVGVFPSSSAFSFAVSLPSCISVLRSRTTKAREEKSLSKILSSFSLSKRARMRVLRSGG